MSYFVDNLDNMLVVRSEMIFSEPVVCVSWYPTGHSWSVAQFNGIARDAILRPTSMPCQFLYEEPGRKAIMVDVLAGTPPVKYEERPIPCPRVRKGVPTRWNSHKRRWEKSLRKGWVAI